MHLKIPHNAVHSLKKPAQDTIFNPISTGEALWEKVIYHKDLSTAPIDDQQQKSSVSSTAPKWITAMMQKEFRQQSCLLIVQLYHCDRFVLVSVYIVICFTLYPASILLFTWLWILVQHRGIYRESENPRVKIYMYMISLYIKRDGAITMPCLAPCRFYSHPFPSAYVVVPVHPWNKNEKEM